MADSSSIFGQIGAAKMFTSNLASSLGESLGDNNAEIASLEEQMAEEQSKGENADKKKIAKLYRKLRRQQKKNSSLNKLNNTVQNANDFLSKLAAKVDIGKNEIIKFLSKIIVYILPSLEIAVKLALLTNIKKMTSCALDINIPDSLRNTGLWINEKEIDPRMTLLISPTSKYGCYTYFGVEEGTSSYKLAKASDMNAFIWFTKHCAKFVSPVTIAPKKLSDYFDTTDVTLTTKMYRGYESGPNFTIGTILKDSAYSNTFYLIEDTYMSLGVPYYSVVPVTNTSTSVNWYTNGASVAGVKIGKGVGKPIFRLEYSNTYNKDASIPYNNYNFKILSAPFIIGSSILTDLGNDVNVALDTVEQTGVELITSGLTNASIKETLSNMRYPSLNSILPKTASFNAKGTYDRTGKFSINQSKFTISLGTSKVNNVIFYKLVPKVDMAYQSACTESNILNLIYDQNVGDLILSYTEPTIESTRGTKITEVDATKVLIECYKGKTIYEFNYDYIMSFKLFDAKTIASNVINSIMSIGLPYTLESLIAKLQQEALELADSVIDSITSSSVSSTASYNQTYINSMTDKMVQKLLDEDTSEYTSCFYEFSNDEYVEMDEATATKVINSQLVTKETISGITEAYNILDGYSADASLNEQSEVITQAFMAGLSANASNSDGSDNSLASNSSTSSSDDDGEDGDLTVWIKNAITALTKELIYSILTPKVLLLIAVNQKLMGNDPLSVDENYNFSIADVIGGMKGIISSIVKQVIDMIQKELLRIILARISQILNKYIQELMLDYAKKWVNFIKSLLSCFKLSKNSTSGSGLNYGNADLDGAINAALNQVDYADLDELAGQILPNTNSCNYTGI